SFVGTTISHHTDGLDWQQNGESLPDGIIETSFADFVQIDRVGFAQNLEFLACNTARAADSETRSRERMATDEAIRQAEFLAEQAYLVLEQFTQWFDELHLHALRQTTDIVVRLDRDRRTAGKRNAFDNIRIERALHEEICAAELLGFFLEHFDKEATNCLARLFRIGFAFQLTDETISSINENEWQVVMFAKHFNNLASFVFTHQPVINQNTGQLITNSFMREKRCNGRIHTTGKRADHFAATDLLTDRFDSLFAICAHSPARLYADDTMNEVLQQLGAI